MVQIDELKNRVYYSQNREDLILESFFLDVAEGFYVDVGASDPVKYSVTKLFYDKGWRGVNIEPIKHHYESLQAQRPRDVNLNIGAGNKNTTITFHEYVDGDGLSTFSTDMVKEYDHLDDKLYKKTKEYEVQVLTLKDIFIKNKVEKINFMKVDVEGFEYDVLIGNDWNRFRPEVICIEANHILKDWRPLLKSNHYELAFFDGLNEYYTDVKTTIRSKFDFVGNVVLKNDGGISNTEYSLMRELVNEIQGKQQTIDDIQTKNTQLNEQYQVLLSENHHNHIKAAVAEKALRSPQAFLKYQIKRLHRVLFRKLSTTRSTLSYTANEREAMDKILHEITVAKTDEQTLKSLQKAAHAETSRIERIYQMANYQPIALRTYMRVVDTVKRVRMRGEA
jgi:FkbM family methyltransferase